MGEPDWKAVLAYVVYLIVGGTKREEAVAQAAEKYGVPESEIWPRLRI